MADRLSMRELRLGAIQELGMLDGATPPPFDFQDNLGIAAPKSTINIVPTTAYNSNYWGPIAP